MLKHCKLLLMRTDRDKKKRSFTNMRGKKEATPDFLGQAKIPVDFSKHGDQLFDTELEHKKTGPNSLAPPDPDEKAEKQGNIQITVNVAQAGIHSSHPAQPGAHIASPLKKTSTGLSALPFLQKKSTELAPAYHAALSSMHPSPESNVTGYRTGKEPAGKSAAQPLNLYIRLMSVKAFQISYE